MLTILTKGFGWSAAASLVLATLARAEPLAYEPFAHAEGTTLAGLSGGSGWAGPWTQDGQSGRIHAPGLGYSDAAGNFLDVTGLAHSTAGTATTRNFRKVAGDPINNVWISHLYHLPASNSKFEGVTFYRGATALFAVSNASTNPGAGIRLENLIGTGTTTLPKGEFGKTHLIVLKLSKGAGPGGVDRVELFVDPLLSATPVQADAVIHGTNYDFDTLRIAGQDGSALLVDELRLAETYADVTPHQAGGDPDSDGDGLTDAQEQVLGLDPHVSDAPLVHAIKQNPHFFGLHTRQGMLALGNGGIVLETSSAGAAEFAIELQSSVDLENWWGAETILRTAQMPAHATFLRLSIEAE